MNGASKVWKRAEEDDPMDRQPVSSTAVASVGYDETSNTLEIEFHSGSVYQYFGVPEYVYKELLQAPSMGNYFSRNIRNSYPDQQL
jgi:hypothetical protein